MDEKTIKALLIRGIEKLFDIDKMYFERIVILKEVVDDIIDLARANHPREFVAFLHGSIKKKRLEIDSLVYQEFKSDETSATPIFHFPDKSFYGSVHSHPSGSIRPSRADRQFFRKVGIVNIIIASPYAQEDMVFYSHEAERIDVGIG